MAGRSRPKVLYVAHNHPAIRPGGAEAYALELYEAMRVSSDFDAVFVARSGPPVSVTSRHHRGTPDHARQRRSRPVLLLHRPVRLGLAVRPLPEKVRAHAILRRVPARPEAGRRALPAHDLPRIRHRARHAQHAAACADRLPLHEYIPICHATAKMVRTMNAGTVRRGVAAALSRVLPAVHAQTFFMRERFIKSHLRPGRPVHRAERLRQERYVDWGSRRRDHGRGLRHASPARAGGPAGPERPRNRFAFFGQLTPYKGADVLLQAMELLGDSDMRRPPVDLRGESRRAVARSSRTSFGELLAVERP